VNSLASWTLFASGAAQEKVTFCLAVICFAIHTHFGSVEARPLPDLTLRPAGTVVKPKTVGIKRLAIHPRRGRYSVRFESGAAEKLTNKNKI
jgi:hypothetical protein